MRRYVRHGTASSFASAAREQSLASRIRTPYSHEAVLLASRVNEAANDSASIVDPQCDRCICTRHINRTKFSFCPQETVKAGIDPESYNFSLFVDPASRSSNRS